MKRPEWKQSTPFDQLTAILGAAEGEYSNWQDKLVGDALAGIPGILPTTFGILRRLHDRLEEIAALQPFLQNPEAW